ncbi:histidine kinase [Pedobacter frigoris]|uniref:histidine kinase n=1 Tax=Pedobacter frigoris TaxID=2571272 RepID=UPI00292E47AE|nr:histidine kinase [Pedobacter frigoris]
MTDIVQIEINKKNRWVYFTRYRWVAHVIYWLWVLIVGTILAVKEPITPSVILHNFFLDNLLIAVFYYTYCLYLIPYFFKRNKNILFWSLVIFLYLSITAIDVYYHDAFVKDSFKNPFLSEHAGFLEKYIANLAGYLLNFVVFVIMLLFMEKNEENHTFLELEKEKKEIEKVKLDLLKTNISPDFLMRSLAQLKQSAAEQENTTPDAILTFSDLLRYRLYRGRQQNAPLTEEVLALQSFIHFIALNHFDNNLTIQLNIQGNTEHKTIAPLSLINIIEPFCKAKPKKAVTLEMIMLIEDDHLLLEMHYSTNADEALVDDLNDYGTNYKQLYGDNVRFEFENCEDERCTISLTLPIS